MLNVIRLCFSFLEDNQNLQQAKVAYEGAKSTFDRMKILYANSACFIFPDGTKIGA
jgi:hypothetical protein